MQLQCQNSQCLQSAPQDSKLGPLESVGRKEKNCYLCKVIVKFKIQFGEEAQDISTIFEFN